MGLVFSFPPPPMLWSVLLTFSLWWPAAPTGPLADQETQNAHAFHVLQSSHHEVGWSHSLLNKILIGLLVILWAKHCWDPRRVNLMQVESMTVEKVRSYCDAKAHSVLLGLVLLRIKNRDFRVSRPLICFWLQALLCCSSQKQGSATWIIYHHHLCSRGQRCLGSKEIKDSRC